MPPEAPTLPYVTPDGKRVALTPEQAGTFEALGYRPEGLGSRVEAGLAQQRENEFGGTAETVRTFGERALSGATLGLSDLALTEYGVDARDLAGRAEINPAAATIGTITGVVGSSLVGGALGAGKSLGSVGQVAGLAPSAKVAALTERILATGAGKGVAGKAATQALGFGVEGALFNSGQYLSDVVLENKQLSGEAFVAAMEGGLFGAGLGGGLSLLGAATRSGSDALAGLLGRKAEKLLQKTEEAVPDVTLSKLTPKTERTPEAIARAESRAETAIVEQNVKVDNLIADADALLAKATEARTRSGGDALDSQIDELLGGADRRIATEGNQQYAELEGRLERLKKSRERVKAWQDSLKLHDPVTGEVAGPGILPQARNRKGQAYSRSDEAATKFAQKRGIQEADLAEREAINARYSKKASDLDTFRDGVEVLAEYERNSFQTAHAFLDLLDNAPAIAETAMPSVGRISEDFAPYLDAVRREVGGSADGPGAKSLFNSIKLDAKSAERVGRDQARAEAKAAREADRAAKAELRQNIKMERETARAEARAAKAKPAGAPGFSVGGLDAGDFLAANEVVGFAGADLRDVPVLGPLLSTWLVASRLKGKLGGVGKLISRHAGGPMVEIAERAASLRNQMADAVTEGVKRTAVAKPALLPAAVALKAPLYESADKPLRSPLRLAEAAARRGNETLSVYKERAQELSQAVADPDAVRERLLLQYPVQDPALFESIYDTAMRKLNYAYDKLPIDAEEPSIYGETVEPSEVELDIYSQVVDALQRPKEAMKVLLGGAPLPHVADAVKNVYPSLYQEAQETVLDQIAKDPAAVPYESRVTLSLLFDLTADRTMRPEYLARVQVAGSEEAQAEIAQPIPSISAPTRLGQAEQTTASRVAGGIA